MPEDIEQLVRQLESAEPDGRLRAAEALLQLQPPAQRAAIALVRAAVDADESVREVAVGTLEELGPPLDSDAGALAALLADENADVAYWAATLLGRLEAGGAIAVDALEAALNRGTSPAVRERAAWALGQIGPAAAAAIESLRVAADDANARLARVAKKAIEQIGG